MLKDRLVLTIILGEKALHHSHATVGDFFN